MKLLKSVIHRFGKWYIQHICRREYEDQQFRRINERPVEFRFLFQQLLRICPTRVLDVGSGMFALPAVMKQCGFIVTAIDNVSDYWLSGMFNRHFHVINDDITSTRIKEKFDFISCISVLEHIENYNDAIKNMFSLLTPGGHLALTFPYNENKYIPNVYKLPEAGYGQNMPYICQVFSSDELNKWIKTNNGKLIEQEYWQFFSGELWTFGEQISPPRQVGKHEKHQLTCILLQKNSDEPLTDN
ncbi:class I SAM-dependent methyltransferase [Desulfonema magnum]|uniref:SAM-dependent methyltransferase domain-containing protein n=1 Tax=Desulfonema magnum TaxID=45655 RepID=A0A975BZY5_9BACT|nr:class I SAM-dependent methyltransferase [Desulfonema magnum]QTA93888.1 SAM-dependent methyltransferase domain-containing protein [Desulfonema magnum]